MSDLLRYVQDVDLARVTAVQCRECKKVHRVTGVDDLFDLRGDGDLLTCTCGAVALIPKMGLPLSDRFPGDLGKQFVAVPHALLDHGAELGLTQNEKDVVIVQTRYYRGPGTPVYPSLQTIADQSGMSRGSVKRATAALHHRGLVPRVRGRRRDGTLGVNRYNLDPLFARLAELRAVQGAQSAVDAPNGSDQGAQSAVDQGANHADQGAKRTPTRAQGAPAEVEVVEEEEIVRERKSLKEPLRGRPEVGEETPPVESPHEQQSTWDVMEALTNGSNGTESSRAGRTGVDREPPDARAARLDSARARVAGALPAEPCRCVEGSSERVDDDGTVVCTRCGREARTAS